MGGIQDSDRFTHVMKPSEVANLRLVGGKSEAADDLLVAGDALMISVVPADVGKPTLKLEKAPVCDGSCYWEKAVLEIVKFIQEPKSGKIHEKIYYFILGTGSLKSGVAGEASIDFSNYAEASKISSVSLPLKNSKSGALLHVSIQRIQDSSDQRCCPDSR